MVRAALVLSGPKSHRIARLVWWVALVLAVPCMEARATEDPPAADVAKTVQQKLQWIHDGERSGMGALGLARLWGSVAYDYEREMELARSEDAYDRALKLLEKMPEGRLDYAILLGNMGLLYMLKGDFDASERYRSRAVDVSRELGDQLTIARSLAHLAEVHLRLHKFEQARDESQQAYNGMIAQKDPNQSEVVSDLSVLSFAECDSFRCEGALDHARTALELAQSLFAADPLPAAQAHMTLGYVVWKTGGSSAADEEMREGIEIMKQAVPPSHPFFLSALEQYRIYLKSTHRGAQSKQVADEIAQIQASSQTPCMSCTVSVNSLMKQ